ncbi:MAG: NUDIX domain-containing protein, partial [Pseudomonadales bacterium]
SWQTQSREAYDRGNGATVLLYNKAQKTVVLIRQFRYPAYANGYEGTLVETCAGVLDEDDPETCVRKETEEETGYQLEHVEKVLEVFMSPGAVTEKIYFFIAEYSPDARIGGGGGLEGDGEDIEVLELPFAEALQMIQRGEICDAKTIMLLQYAALNQIFE